MKDERRDQIAELVSRNRTVTNAELMERFSISIETVRRDLAALERLGVLERVYGGAIHRRANPQEPGYAFRETAHAEEKLAIARLAETLITQNDTVYFDNGTTVFLVAEQLRDDKHIVAFTNVLRNAVALADKKQTEVILLGGQLRPNELCTSGSDTQEQLTRFNIEKAIIGSGIKAIGATNSIFAANKL